MSVVRYITVICDGCGYEYAGGGVYLAEARRSARSDGWRSTPAMDACPECRLRFRSGRLPPRNDRTMTPAVPDRKELHRDLA